MEQEQTTAAPVAVVETTPYVLREIDSDDTVKRVKYFVDISTNAARVSVQAALAAGYELIRAKQTVKYGLWVAFCAKCGLNIRSANRYMSLAGSVNETLRSLAEDGAALPLDMIASSARELEGKSLTQLYSDFGIVRKSGAWGGARAGAGRPQLEGGAAGNADLRAEAELFGADPELNRNWLCDIVNRLETFAGTEGVLAGVDAAALRNCAAALKRVEKLLAEALRAKGADLVEA